MFSVESYPDPYCGIVDGMATACLEMNILELWANDGAFNQQGSRKKYRSSLTKYCSGVPQAFETFESLDIRTIVH